MYIYFYQQCLTYYQTLLQNSFRAWVVQHRWCLKTKYKNPKSSGKAGCFPRHITSASSWFSFQMISRVSAKATADQVFSECICCLSVYFTSEEKGFLLNTGECAHVLFQITKSCLSQFYEGTSGLWKNRTYKFILMRKNCEIHP